jgi:hypothetical protein
MFFGFSSPASRWFWAEAGLKSAVLGFSSPASRWFWAEAGLKSAVLGAVWLLRRDFGKEEGGVRDGMHISHRERQPAGHFRGERAFHASDTLR